MGTITTDDLRLDTLGMEPTPESDERHIHELHGWEHGLNSGAPDWLKRVIDRRCKEIEWERAKFLDEVKDADLHWAVTFSGPPFDDECTQWGFTTGYRPIAHGQFEVAFTPDHSPAAIAKILRDIANQIEQMDDMPQPDGPPSLSMSIPF